MELIEVNANIRTTTGNGPSRRLRSKGKVPAILYGPNTETIMLSVDINEFKEIFKKNKGKQVLFNLAINNNGDSVNRTAIIKELQIQPLSGERLHIDFYEIAMDRKIRVKVPVVTEGRPKGVEFGGMLQIIRRELEVLCLPLEIPDVIKVDVTDLDMGDSIHVKEIPLQGDIEIPTDVNFTVVTVLSPKKEEEEETVEEDEEGIEEEEQEETEEQGTDKKQK